MTTSRPGAGPGTWLDYEIVDVFTDAPFAGNPLAVVLGADDLSTTQLQALAREFNLSETAFPVRPSDDERARGADYRLRIFTPAAELPFAGHPSVGAAWVQARRGAVRPGRVVQACGAGLLPLTVAPDGQVVELSGGTPGVSRAVDAEGWLAAVALAPGDLTGEARVAGTGTGFVFLPVVPDAIERAHPISLGTGAPRADQLPEGVTTLGGVSVFAWDGELARTRVFAGLVGVPEDPATGSAAVGFGAYLVAAGLAPGEGETRFTIEQGVRIGRRSVLRGRVRAEGGQAREVLVAGGVVAVATGRIVVPPTESVENDHAAGQVNQDQLPHSSRARMPG